MQSDNEQVHGPVCGGACGALFLYRYMYIGSYTSLFFLKYVARETDDKEQHVLYACMCVTYVCEFCARM